MSGFQPLPGIHSNQQIATKCANCVALVGQPGSTAPHLCLNPCARTSCRMARRRDTCVCNATLTGHA